MTKADMAEILSKKLSNQKRAYCKAETERFLNITLALIGDALADGDKVTFSNFGTFGIKKTDFRVGRNLQTGKPVTIPAGVKAYFKPSKKLQTKISNTK